jgi:hypothetical protein
MLSAGDARGKYLAVYDAYWDESGTGEDDPVLTVAGFLSTPRRWGRFISDWQAALADWELPYFHMSQYVAKGGPYAAWSEAERVERCTRLVDIIVRHCAGSVGLVLPLTVYQGAIRPEVGTYYGGRLGLASHACIVESAGLLDGTMKIKGVRRINHVFEKGAVGQGKVAALWKSEYDDERRRNYLHLGSITHADKREFLPLQAADIMAWELHWQGKNQLADVPKEVRQSLRRIAELPHRWYQFGAEGMGAWQLITIFRYWNEQLGPRPNQSSSAAISSQVQT